MQLHDVNGVAVEIAEDEIKRVWPDMARRIPGGQHFTIGGRTVMLTVPEMKEISRYYWEHFGKHDMVKFYEKYQHKAAEHIMRATHASELPMSEENVKSALAYAVAMGEPGLISEVVFESTEWAIAYAALESIEE